MKRISRSWMVLTVGCLACIAAMAQQNIISTLVGGGPNNVPAVDADIYSPSTVVVDGSGNYYIAAYDQNRVFKVNSSGTLTVLAGSGVAGYTGDGVSGGAANASLNGPYGLAVDSSGNVYVSDYANSVVRKIDRTNTITTIAGIQGTCGYNGEGSPATRYKLCDPAGLTVDTNGNLYIADSGNCRVRQVALSSSTIDTYAGNGTCSYGGDTGLATSAKLNTPYGVAADSAANIYISDTLNYRIRKVTASTGIIASIAGNGTSGFSGDGGLARSAQIGGVDQGVTVDGPGQYLTLGDVGNNRVRHFKVGGNINTIAGTGSASYCGDGGAALSACLNSPDGVALSGTEIFVADAGNNRIREFKFNGTGSIATVAGNGGTSQPALLNQVQANGVVLNYPWGAVEDPSGNIFASDQDNFMVRELVQATGMVDYFAGSGMAGYGGDNGSATQGWLNYPGGVARDGSGNIYIADTYNHVVREVGASGTITTFAGTPGSCGYSGDGGSALSAQLCYPQSVSVDNDNNVYIADTNNQAIRLVTGGTISTIAGNGTQGYSGDGGAGISAQLNYPDGVAADNLGDIYIADTSNCVIREMNLSSGVINTVAGDGFCGFTGDGSATQNELYYPAAVTADTNGNFFIADSSNNLLRWVNPAGNMVTFAGTPLSGYNGDGGPATSAELNDPTSIAQDSDGNFLVADQSNFRIRGVSAFAAANPQTNSVVMPDTAVGLSTSQAFTVTGLGPLRVSGLSASGDFSVAEQAAADRTARPCSNLANGQKCTLKVSFKPTAPGPRAGALVIKSNAYFGGQTTVNLQGVGGAIAITGNPMSFGAHAVNTTSAAKMIKITNVGHNKLSMGSIALNETLDFAIVSNSCKSSLAPLVSCYVKVTFKPITSGPKASAMIIQDSDATSPQTVSITGSGT